MGSKKLLPLKPRSLDPAGYRPKILHVITGLGQGGAERQLSNLVGYGSDAFQAAVFSIRPLGIMAGPLETNGAVVSSGEARNPLSLGWLRPLRKAVKIWDPDLVVGWMYHGNLGASLTRVLGYDGPVVWNVRHSVEDLKREKWGTRSVIRLGARFSGSASRIIYNSEVAAGQHEQLGYQVQGRIVVPNGFDVKRFRPDPSARRKLRSSIGIADTDLALGVFGRSHPMKNHKAWIGAFAKLGRENQGLHCIMMGVGVDDPRGPVAKVVKDSGMVDRVHLLPPTDSPEAIYPALDLLVLPSAFGEGISNVVGEAMACGVPAAVTDVGDSLALVGTTGFEIEGAQPEQLAAGVTLAIRLGQGKLSDLGGLARDRIIKNYSLERIGKQYYSVLCDILDPSRGLSGC